MLNIYRFIVKLRFDDIGDTMDIGVIAIGISLERIFVTIDNISVANLEVSYLIIHEGIEELLSLFKGRKVVNAQTDCIEILNLLY
jgi:hypothetical protein